MSNILICDDEKDIVSALRICLAAEGYEIFEAYNGIQALEIIEANDIHLVLLDIMMPEMDGIETAKEIRKQYSMPIIMLSAKSEDYDKILGLNMGADDYVTKPFSPMELIARVNSTIRRYTKLGNIVEKDDKNIYKTGDLVINDMTKEVSIDGRIIKFTPTEYNILCFLTQNKGKVFSIKQIYENVWNEEGYGAENIIAVHIRHIREKIEINPKEPKYLKVIWGIGYKIENI